MGLKLCELRFLPCVFWSAFVCDRILLNWMILGVNLGEKLGGDEELGKNRRD